MANTRYTKARGQIDISVAIYIQHIAADSFRPDNGVVVDSTERRCPPGSSGSDRWALAVGEAINPCSTAGSRYFSDQFWRVASIRHGPDLSRWMLTVPSMK